MLDIIDWLGPTRRWQSWSIVGGNLLPLLGILWLDWDASTLVILYWMETAVVGFWTILRLAFGGASSGSEFRMTDARGISRPATGVALSLFLLVHSAIFMGVHLAFLTFLAPGAWSDHLASPADFWINFIFPSGLWIPLAGLFVARGIVTVGEIRARQPVSHLVAGFYARIVLMQFVILIGGFVSLMLGSPAPLLVLIVALKTVVELYWDEIARSVTGR